MALSYSSLPPSPPPLWAVGYIWRLLYRSQASPRLEMPEMNRWTNEGP